MSINISKLRQFILEKMNKILYNDYSLMNGNIQKKLEYLAIVGNGKSWNTLP